MNEGQADETCTDVAIFAGADVEDLVVDKLDSIDVEEMADVAEITGGFINCSDTGVDVSICCRQCLPPLTRVLPECYASS
jgi:hypothetical protein